MNYHICIFDIRVYVISFDSVDKFIMNMNDKL